MVTGSKECLRETRFVLCLRPRKEIISGSLEWIYIVFQDAIYANLKSMETKEVQKLAHFFFFPAQEQLTVEGYGLCSRAQTGSTAS